jgi:O-antigen ligase
MEAVATIAVAGAVVWGTVLLVRGGLLAAGLAVLLAGCCLGYPLFHLPTSPIPLTLDRLLWLVLLAQYAVWRKLGWAAPKPIGTADVVLGLLLGVLGLSTLTHDWEAHNALAISRLAFFYVMPVGLYWTARQSMVSQRAVSSLLVCLTVFGVYLAVTAFGERYDAPWLVFPPYILSPEYPEFLGRARGPFLTPVGNGIFLGTCLAAGLLLWARLGRWGRLALLPVLLLIAGGAYLTLTRSVWMGAGLGLVAVVALAVPPAWRRWLLAGSLVAVVLVATTQWERLLSFKRDKALSAGETAESAKLRPILATVAWKMFLDRPLGGCGFGQYGDASKEYLADRSTDLPLEKARPFVQHNVLLALLTETGLAGMGLFAALLTLWSCEAWRLWRSPQREAGGRQLGLLFLAAAANYLVNGMFHDVAIIPMVNMLLFFLAGMTVGLMRPAIRPCRPLSGSHDRLGADPLA